MVLKKGFIAQCTITITAKKFLSLRIWRLCDCSLKTKAPVNVIDMRRLLHDFFDHT